MFEFIKNFAASLNQPSVSINDLLKARQQNNQDQIAQAIIRTVREIELGLNETEEAAITKLHVEVGSIIDNAMLEAYQLGLDHGLNFSQFNHTV